MTEKRHAPNVCTNEDGALRLCVDYRELNRLRWIDELADCNFNIHYRPSKAGIDADTLSRMYFQTTQQVLQETISGVQCQDKIPWLTSLYIQVTYL